MNSVSIGVFYCLFFFQAEDGIRDLVRSRGLGDVYKRQALVRLISVPVMEGGEVRMMTGVGNKATLYDANDVETVQLLGNEAWRIVRRQRAEKALRIANQVVNASPVVCFRWAAVEGLSLIHISEPTRPY